MALKLLIAGISQQLGDAMVACSILANSTRSTRGTLREQQESASQFVDFERHKKPLQARTTQTRTKTTRDPM
jgi:hypothetical protein